jgi:diketogulonate reductase-like aldo/keto reductase
MDMRRLGQTDLMVSPLCLGGNVFGWTADEATSFKVLDGFVDAGLNFVDTADVYSAWVPGHTGGESERIIGRWMKACGSRGKVVPRDQGWVGARPLGHSHPRGGRVFPQAAADRLHRPVPIAQGRPEHAA